MRNYASVYSLTYTVLQYMRFYLVRQSKTAKFVESFDMD